MASFSPRKRTEWCVTSVSRSAQNRVFISEPAARKYADDLRAGGLANVRVNSRETTTWTVRIRCKGAPDFAKTFERRADAEAWAREKEGDIAKRQFVDHRSADRTTLAELLSRYERDCLSHQEEHHPDRSRARKLSLQAMALLPLSSLTRADIANYRDARLRQVKGTTVRKEIELISRVVQLARREWGIHLAENPASGQVVTRPRPQPGDERDRRLLERHAATPQALEPSHRRRPVQAARLAADSVESDSSSGHDAAPGRGGSNATQKEGWVVPNWVVTWMQLPQTEEQALLRACRYPHWFQPHKAGVGEHRLRERASRMARQEKMKARHRRNGRFWAVVSFAMETAMRRGELLKLRWEHVDLELGCLDLPGSITKNKRPRLVPLTVRALRILRTQPRVGDGVFPMTEETLDQAFVRARKRAGAPDLRFHDLRHEATSRLFERTTLRESEIGFVTGHCDPRMLQRYYNKRAGDIVARFHASFTR